MYDSYEKNYVLKNIGRNCFFFISITLNTAVFNLPKPKQYEIIQTYIATIR
jgi:hypothetical protein